MVLPSFFGHEAYVLPKEEFDAGLGDHSVNIFDAIVSAHNKVLFLVFLAGLGLIFSAALFFRYKPIFSKLGKFLDNWSQNAQLFIRVAFGASLLLSALNNSLFGPELPLDELPLSQLLKIVMVIAGASLIIGFKIRFFASASVLLWFFALGSLGSYMITYINYLGEGIALLLLPALKFSLDSKMASATRLYKYEQYSFPVARILFALSLIYTAITVKFMSTILILEVITEFEIDNFFHLDALFIVICFAVIELLMGVAFLLGVLQRFTAFTFLVGMTISIAFFGESVWPHILIIALGVGLFIHKPDKYSVDSRFLGAKKSFREVVRGKLS